MQLKIDREHGVFWTRENEKKAEKSSRPPLVMKIFVVDVEKINLDTNKNIT